VPNTVLRSVLVPPFPVNTLPLVKGKDGEFRLAYPYVKFFQSVEQALNSSAQVQGNVPAHTNSAGEAGTLAGDANFVYFCYAKNSWIQIPGTTAF
jgi:hypothetical protein